VPQFIAQSCPNWMDMRYIVSHINKLGASVKKNDTADNLLLKDRIEK